MHASSVLFLDRCQSKPRRAALAAIAVLLVASQAKAQAPTPARWDSYSREVAFTYEADGRLKTETIEPNAAAFCVTTTHGYDAYGNKVTASIANCENPTEHGAFDSRSNSVAFDGGVNVVIQTPAGQATVLIPHGQFVSRATNAVGHVETQVTDPRFGGLVTRVGPNSLKTEYVLDDVGRQILEKRPDGTVLKTRHCILPGKGIDIAMNSADCPTPMTGEAPIDALGFFQTELQNATGQKIGAFKRTYSDRAARKIREVTEAFDGAGQPSATVGDLIVKDTVFNAQGATVLMTQPYFLKTGSSLLSGTNTYGMSMTTYDCLGRSVQVDVADTKGTYAGINFLGRGTRQSARTTHVFSGLAVTSRNTLGLTRTEERGIDGKIILVTDATGAQIFHQYDAFQNLYKTIDPFGNSIVATHTVRGTKAQLEDPDSGRTRYDYNAIGELVWQQTPKQALVPQASTFAYDAIGRMISRSEPDYQTAWSFDSCRTGIGKLCSATTSGTNATTRTYAYDFQGRPISSRTDVVGGISYATGLTYNSNGQPDTQTYPTGLRVRFSYSGRGILDKVILVTAASVVPFGGASHQMAANSVLWTNDKLNAFGKSELQTDYNGVLNRASFDSLNGSVISLSAGKAVATDVVDTSYTWDALNRMEQRLDSNGAGGGVDVVETFTYDRASRLSSHAVSGASTRSVSFAYNAVGNVLFKSDLGNYNYVGAKPNAVKTVTGSAVSLTYGLDPNGNVTSGNGKYGIINYTTFNLPDTIRKPSAGQPTYSYQYDESHGRLREKHDDASGSRVTWYAHPDNMGGLAFEREEFTSTGGTVTTQNRHYVSANGGVIAVLVSAGALPALGTKTTPDALASITLVKSEYWHKDNLGSLVATTNHAGTVTARYAYDPFGKRRSLGGTASDIVADWTPNSDSGTDRGFTGHEHLDDIGVIHMNGRLFDPLIGRFLQVDPEVQDVTNLQNYDRYGYCFNSPMGCTDPSGYSFWGKLWKAIVTVVKIIIICIIIYFTAGAGSPLFIGATGLGALGAAAPIVSAAIGGFLVGAIQTGTLKGALQGAFTAAVFAGVAASGIGGASGSVGSVAVQGVTGCVTAAATGGKCGAGALSAAFSEAVMPNVNLPKEGTVRLIVSAIVGGTASVLGGGKFSNGAISAAMTYAIKRSADLNPTLSTPNQPGTLRIFVGGLADNELGMEAAFRECEASGGSCAYFRHDQPQALAAKIAEVNGDANLDCHSWGADTCAAVVGLGSKVKALRTFDPVSKMGAGSWIGPSFADVLANTESWTNYEASDKTHPANTSGAAWDNRAAAFSNNIKVPGSNHVTILRCLNERC